MAEVPKNFARHAYEVTNDGAPNPTIRKEMLETNFAASAGDFASGQEFDFIICGAGSAGCSLAHKLCSTGEFSVLLIEAGGEGQNLAQVKDPKMLVTLWNSEIDWNYVSDDLKYLTKPDGTPRKIFLERGKTLGGSSAINAMMWVRGAKEDFDRWAAQGGEEGALWSHDNVVKNFKEIERVDPTIADATSSERGVDGPLQISALQPTDLESAFEASAVACGMLNSSDYNAEMARGFGSYGTDVVARMQFNADATDDHKNGLGRRQDAFSSFVQPVLDQGQSKLRVVSQALVRRVLLEKPTGGGGKPKAVGVEIELPRGHGSSEMVPVVARARKEVILSAGAINSPQLLLLSGVGDACELQKVGVEPLVHVPGVGRNMQDHPNCGIGFRFRDSVDLSPRSINSQGMVCFLQSPVCARREAESGIPRGPDLQFVLGARGLGNPAHSAKTYYDDTEEGEKGRLLRWENRRELHERMRVEYQAVLKGWDKEMTTWTNNGGADGRLPDRGGGIGVILNQVYGLKRAVALVRSEPFASRVDWSWGISGMRHFDWDDDAALEAYVRASSGTTWHYSCTCMMGDVSASGDPDAVVDARLRVRGVDGLRVADASVMPQVTSGNTNAPCIMIGNKAGELLLEEHASATAIATDGATQEAELVPAAVLRSHL